jgi:Na+-driven multidrug efflux pump
LDQFIIYDSTNKVNQSDRVLVPHQVWIPLILVLIFFSALLLFGEILGVFNYFSIGSDEIEFFTLIFSVSILFGIYSKVSAAVLLSLGEVKKANYLFLGKAIGLFVSVLIVFFFSVPELFWLPVILVELAGFLILIPFVLRRFHVKGFDFKKKYIMSGVNVFSFDAIMKADLIILSFFDFPEFLIFYAVVSSVFEGFVQVLSSYRYQFAHIVKKTFDISHFYSILKISFLVVIGFSPAAMIFSYLVLGHFASEWLVAILVLQSSIILGVYGIITFHFFELQGRPINLTILALVSVTLNIIVGVLLIPVVGAVGVAFGTLASFTMLSLVNFITFQRYWVKIKYFNNRTG